MPRQEPFSKLLHRYLSSPQPVTIQGLIATFKEKSFAVLFLLLMAVPALPLPTGGLTHIFELMVMLLALELFVGRSTIWLPKKWASKPLPRSLQTAVLPKFITILQWFEKLSRQRLPHVLHNPLTIRLSGVVVFLFALFALLAPPFSGLDTLPALGIVLLSLALLFDDAILSIIGVATGSAGVFVIILLGRAALHLFG